MIVASAQVDNDEEDGRTNLRFHSIYTGAYDKTIFGNYIGLLRDDIRRASALDETQKAFA